MGTSIQHFTGSCTADFEKAVVNFASHPEYFYEFVKNVLDTALKLAQDIISQTLDDLDKCIVESEERKRNWNIVRTDTKQLVTSAGTITFHKTLFKHKATGKRAYLLDKNLRIESHERISEDAKARMLEEASETSYARAGESASIFDSVSKQAVKDLVHGIDFPSVDYSGEKKTVDYLYIDADEDHIALQKQGAGGAHSTIGKMVYVYEGIEPECPGSKRNRLVNSFFFCGLYPGKENKKLWAEVCRYVEQHYDLSKIKGIYLNGDGGSWIKGALTYMDKVTFVLDGFHLSQCVTRMTACLGEKAAEAKGKIFSLIKAGKRKELQNFARKVAAGTDSEAEEKRMLEGLGYILNNFAAARLRLDGEAEGLLPCSAEGHVSHVLSARMSSRPMAWSRAGADKLIKLRAYKLNGGKMIDLVRMQRKEVDVEADETVLSAHQILAFEKRTRKKYGKYFDSMQCSVNSEAIRKLLNHCNFIF